MEASPAHPLDGDEDEPIELKQISVRNGLSPARSHLFWTPGMSQVRQPRKAGRRR